MLGDDADQIASIAAWQAELDHDPAGLPLAQFRRIRVKQALVDAVKAALRKKRRWRSPPADYDATDPGDGPPEIAARRELAALAVGLLRRVEGRPRQLLTWWLAGVPAPEIASRWGVTESAVHKMRQRTLARMAAEARRVLPCAAP